VKRQRNNREVVKLLKDLEQKARTEEENLVPHLIQCVKDYVTIQEVCDVMRQVFGEYEASSPL